MIVFELAGNFGMGLCIVGKFFIPFLQHGTNNGRYMNDCHNSTTIHAIMCVGIASDTDELLHVGSGR